MTTKGLRKAENTPLVAVPAAARELIVQHSQAKG